MDSIKHSKWQLKELLLTITITWIIRLIPTFYNTNTENVLKMLFDLFETDRKLNTPERKIEI